MINTITLNPGIDQILYFDRFRKGVTNRIRNTKITVGGKGTHVSMNLSVMGIRSRAFGLAYGGAGKYIMDTLGESGVDVHFCYRVDCESRTNYVLVEDDGTSTLISEKGERPTAKDTEELVRMIQEHVQPGDALVLSGDTSNHPDPHIYAHMMDLLDDKGLRVYVDASGATLKETLAKRPFLIKPNEDELTALCGYPLDTEMTVIRAVSELYEQYGIPVIAVSLGGKGSIVRADGKFFRAIPPAVKLVNTVGCGDCFLAGLLSGFEHGLGVEETLTHATAVSAAAAECPLSVGFDPARAMALMSHVKVIEVNG